MAASPTCRIDGGPPLASASPPPVTVEQYADAEALDVSVPAFGENNQKTTGEFHEIRCGSCQNRQIQSRCLQTLRF